MPKGKGSKTPKAERVTTEQELRRWVVARGGETDQDLPFGPAVRIIVTAHVDRVKSETLAYSASAEFLGSELVGPSAEKWTMVSSDAQIRYKHKRENGAFSAARKTISEHVYTQYLHMLHAGKADAMKELDVLRKVCNDCGGMELARLNGRARVQFEMLSGDDMLFAHKVAAEHFKGTDGKVNVAFRLRKPGDGKPWQGPLMANGKRSTTLGQCKKVSAEQREVYRTILGYSPDIMVTIDYPTWRDLDPEGRARIIHHELSHVLVDPDKGTARLVAHDVGEFSATAEQYPDVVLREMRPIIGPMLKRAAELGKGLEFFGSDPADFGLQESGNQSTTPAKRKTVPAVGVAGRA